MTKIPTSYCLVTRDRETLKKFIKEGKSLSELEQELSAKKSFLFSSKNNANFISFSASFKADNMVISLKFIDPKNEFFSRFISRSVSDALDELEIAPSAELPVTLSEGAAKQDFENSIKKLQEEISKTYAVSSSPTENDSTNLPQFDFNKDDLFTLGAITQAFGQDTTVVTAPKPLELGQDLSLYVTFGVGQDLKYWVGPLRVAIRSSSISVDKGKVITLGLVPSETGPEDQKKSKGVITKGKEIIIEGSSRNIDLKNLSSVDEDLPAYSPFINQDNVSSKTKKIIGARFDELQEEEETKKSSEIVKKLKIDYHYLIVDCIRSFLQKAYRTKNVIVLIPDINKFCSKKIEEAFSEAAADDPTPTAKGVFGSFSFSKATKLIKRLSPFYRSIKVDSALKSFLTSMGFSYVSSNKEDTSYPQGRNSIYSIGAINKLVQTERSQSMKESNQKFYEDNNFYCKYTVVDHGKEPDAKSAVDDIVNAINSATNEGSLIFPSLSYEINSNIIDVLYKYSEDDNYPLIPKGMKANEPCLIFGNKNTISTYFYKSKKGKDDNMACLHPADEALLSNDKFIKELKVAKNSSINESGFVDTLYPSADQLALDIHKMDQKVGTLSNLAASLALAGNISTAGTGVDQTEADRVPIFKFNTKNPNVLNFSIEQNNAIFASLQAGVTKYKENKATILAQGTFPEGTATFKQLSLAEEKKREIIKNQLHGLESVDIKLDEAANKYLQNLFKKNPVAANVAYQMFRYSSATTVEEQEGLLKQAEAGNLEAFNGVPVQGLGAAQLGSSSKFKSIDESVDGAEDLKRLIALRKDYEKLQEFSETAPEIKISQNSAEVPATVLSESRKLLIDTVGVATITTLPFFHIFGPKDVAKTCYFFVNEPPIFGSDSNYENALSSFISGRKKITSMYHEIDARGRAFSEFTLVRN
jgi:hypothetical protein